MPFKSQAQRKLFYAKESRGELPKGTAAKWEAHTPAGKLPEHVKKASSIKIPKGGLKPGLLMNDLTQTMNSEDAKKVKKNLPFYRRSGPGILPQAAIGALGASSMKNLYHLAKGQEHKFRTIQPKAAAIGAVAQPALWYALMRAGAYDKQALKASKRAIERSKHASLTDLYMSKYAAYSNKELLENIKIWSRQNPALASASGAPKTIGELKKLMANSGVPPRR